MVQILHQLELVLLLKLTKDWYVIFKINKYAYTNFTRFSVFLNQRIDLKTQLSYFKNLVRMLRNKIGDDQEVKTLLTRAVHLFSIGTNDYAAPFLTNSSMLQSYSREEYVHMVIGNMTDVIKVIKTNILLTI